MLHDKRTWKQKRADASRRLAEMKDRAAGIDRPKLAMAAAIQAVEDAQFKIKSVFCPYSKGACDRRCPAWNRGLYTTEAIWSEREKGYCNKLENLNEEGRLIV